MNILNKITKLIRKIKYSQEFNKLDCLKGLNPDKHQQVFDSYFWNKEEQGRFNK